MKQKLDLDLPFPIGAHWQSYKKDQAKKDEDVNNRIFVVYSISTERLSDIKDLTRKRDGKYGRKAHLIVVLKINKIGLGNILQAIIFVKSVILVKDIEWVDVGEKILRCLADTLNSAEKSDYGIKKWHFNKDNIILVAPSKLIQHNITEKIKECMQKIASNGK
ncbi:MAG: hypothetical protein Q8N37_02065 [bacterium]|nr:hypothetical protein [bacterium]